jgi:Flp pilus assembly protein TadB
VIACLLPTGIRFYAQDGEWWAALRGWVLMAVALVVVFFAAGGFAVTNLNAGVEVRAERSTAEIDLAQRRLDAVTTSRAAECAKRGERCRKLEGEERDAIAALERLRADVKADADPQAAAIGVSPARLHAIQAGSMVLLCLFSSLCISFGAGLIWRRPAPRPAVASKRERPGEPVAKGADLAQGLCLRGR